MQAICSKLYRPLLKKRKNNNINTNIMHWIRHLYWCLAADERSTLEANTLVCAHIFLTFAVF